MKTNCVAARTSRKFIVTLFVGGAKVKLKILATMSANAPFSACTSPVDKSSMEAKMARAFVAGCNRRRMQFTHGNASRKTS